ncbi:hypothetical protein [Bowmanella sp. JS7-9]|uniref:Zinc-ribbon domain-containing protein n=1 Tax=Pseudobowmanella zhangzhouensis TaxID=1537679 RepID=A0ABW1XKR5_9ALTE|nr:hypothetical protein [Bowmanella sp. JS7-9]TBX27344.1 zn-ribbon protein [Bowmanella sp. JS7-9]
MALVDCPACSKKISDKARTCQHCGFAIGDADADDILRKAKYQKFKKKQSLMNQSMLAMLMFIAGFAVIFWGEPEMNSLQQYIGIGCCVIGFCWYILNRLRLILLKKGD